MKTKFLFSLYSLLSLLALVLLMLSPETAAEAVRRGLGTCAVVIIPSLLPFFFVSGIISALGIPRLLAAKIGPFTQRALGLPGLACAPLLMGLMGGYPVGAAALAEIVRSGELSPREGEKLLVGCNNTGPAFIVGTAGFAVFGSTRAGLLLYCSHAIAAIAAIILFFHENTPSSVKNEPFSAKIEFSEILPKCVKNSVFSTLNICGFVVFFSVITAFLEHFGIFTYLSGELSAGLGLELHFCQSLLSGLLELGSGVASMRGLSAAPMNLALASFILGFGSLSVHCQTLAVISGTNMKCARHFAGRIVHGVLSALFTFVFAHFFRI